MNKQTSTIPMPRQRLFKAFLYVLVGAGAMVVLLSVRRFPHANLNWRFLVLALITGTVASRLTIRIPHTKGEVTVGDTLIFLAMLLYGGEAAILLAAVDALGSSLRVSKKARVVLFNTAQMTCSTFATVWVLRFCFGPISELHQLGYSGRYVAAICTMALVQYGANSGLVAVYTAIKNGAGIWTTWRQYYLWTSITYFAGASVAGITVILAGTISIYALIIITPIVAIIYFTYRTYLKHVETSADKVEQARLHVDELSRYIEEQERIREQFSQIEKMSALGQLASGVAHDFNNTLAGILGRAELLLKRANDPETRRGLKLIVQAATDGGKTVKRIQDFARQRSDHDFLPISVGQLLIDVNEITQPRWKDRAQAKNVHINLDLQVKTDAPIMGDASELREVLVNMVFNAVDAMPNGGRLQLLAEEVDGAIEIAVTDTGVGMSPEVSSRIFDPFYTTKGDAGMGLGLAVCYGIVQRHQGTIEVKSELGHGTAFRIRLPIAETKPIADAPEETPVRLTLVHPSHSPKILVVDDEEYVRELLNDVLESEGYKVTLAENGKQALSLLEEQDFEAVFTDVGMPGMSGWELARAIRERDTSIPIAVITGWGEAVGSMDQEQAKVDWVVSKPFSITRISEILTEISSRSGIGGRLAQTAIVA